MKERFALALTLLMISAAIVAAQEEPVNFNNAYVELDRSPEGLEAYKSRMQALQKDLPASDLRRVHSTITFSRPLSLEDAADIAKSFEVRPLMTYAFARSSSGDLLTIGGRFKEGFKEGIERIVADDHDGPVKLIGVVAMVASVDVANVEKAQMDSRVFLVDISADQNLVNNPRNRDYMQHFGWDLYQHAQERVEQIDLK